MAAIATPNFTGPTDEGLVEAFVNTVTDHYFPDTGSYFTTNVHNHGNNTFFHMNLAETIRIMATEGVPDEDHIESIAMISGHVMANFSAIVEKLKEVSPAKLEALNWRCTKMDICLYDAKKFCGKNKDGNAIYGASCFKLFYYIEPIPGKIPVSCGAYVPKDKFTSKQKHVKQEKQEKQEDQEEEENDNKMSETAPAPAPVTAPVAKTVKQTYLSASKQTAPVTPVEAGGAAAPVIKSKSTAFTGRKPSSK